MTRYLKIASALLALAAAAPAVHAETQGQIAIRVSYADLNMASIAGRHALDQRVSRAIDKACGERPDYADLGRVSAFRSCEKAAWSSVQGQLKSISTAVADNSDVTPAR